MRFFTLALTALATSAVVPALELAPVPELATRNFFLGSNSSFDLFSGLDAEGCAAFAGACLGAKASAIESSARASLDAWIGSADLSASLKTSLKSWCSGSVAELDVDVIAELAVYIPIAVGLAAEGGLSVSISGITSTITDAGVALDASLRADLTAFLKAHVNLDSEVNVALEVCASGGVVAALTADVKAAILAYVESSDCSLSASLIAAIKLWCAGKAGSGVSIIGDIPNAASISASVGASITAAIDSEGIIASSFVSALKTWIVSIDIDLDADIKAALELIIEGKTASSLDDTVIIKLTQWLFSEKCSLAGQLKAVVLVWLYVRATVGETVSILSVTDIATLTAWFEGDVSASLSAVVKGVIATAIAGEAVVNVSLDAVAQLVAVISGLVTGVSVDIDIVVILAKWVTGNTCGCY
ncbi:hypothetical protein PISL3812_05372 [Talaromyces islandicus]|uniref:Cell wall protein n=1 Tax=Talaromyces islandicus TaxID=28573 RepID=A0A0U1LZ23_TALIS|nr:hypothetical protein PISL3812_05372 [Talaromyces islandicus]